MQLSGLASGLDTNTIIEQLMAAERRPQAKVKLREKQVQAEQTALKDVAMRLRNLKNAAADLRSASLWNSTQSVSVNDPTKLDARRLSGAAPGGFSVSVTQLAQAEQRTYAFSSSAAPSTITFNKGTAGELSIDVAAGADLEAVVESINSRTDAPVAAAAVSGQLVLASKKTGTANGFTASGATLGDPAATDTALAVRAGRDAVYQIDNDPPRTSTSNVVSDGLAGVELTLKATGSGMTVNVGAPALDRKALVDKVKGFVDQYNSSVEFVRSKVGEKRVRDAATDADAVKGALFSDTMLTGLLGQLRNSLTERVGDPANPAPAEFDELRELGISTAAATGGASSADALAGKLVFDEAKFTAALDRDPSAVRRALGGVTGSSGLAQRFEGLLDPAVKAGGSIDARVSSGDARITQLRDRLEQMDRRLELQEKRLRTQFTAMERALNSSQSQGAYLSSQIAGLQR